jgi:ABC-type multidrug transport system fused ATPase/permease subunit
MHPGATRETRATAYVYAALIPLSMILSAEVELQHLWFGRRAATRTRSELMALIYAKALKRKDFSGVVDPSRGADTPQSTRGGADVGKIVNLMSGDVDRIANVYSYFYFLYQPPLEVAIASFFLFQLLGPSTLVGVAILILNWPFNSIVMRRSIKIQGELSTARDKRMSVLNELLSAIKIVKLFAWGNVLFSPIFLLVLIFRQTSQSSTGSPESYPLVPLN